ncbi:glycoside hydrolase family 3 N-terminal domain-containing protein [Herbiconiux sp. SYSU D00978]|uniref:glycoside hydrolase family 3 N-terminal domain-containing protein n=1 Tax=Herbiconiux sp. SYSU D00978 TaxID=2812562 RepID=UPI001A96E30B|nr:glycoside hydrolase family 3 N-terminal domain-containing protein [Herbiconiux sp. SYSU D00978]
MLHPLRVLSLLLVILVIAGCAGAAPTLSRATRTELPPPPDPFVLAAERRLAAMTLEEKVASLLMLHAPGTDAAAISSYVGTHRPGGLIVMRDNVPPDDEARLAEVTAAMQLDPALPLLVGIDQEGGPVRRVTIDPTPGARALRDQDAGATRDAFATRAALLTSLGVNTNFGIVADVTGERSSFIWSRTLGDTAELASPRVVAALEGEEPVLSAIKHFPGHGVTPADSHETVPGTPMGYDQWRAEVAGPFEAGIGAGAELVMMGHLRYEAVDPQPASLSPEWHRVLREELGFDGIIVTDDLRMLEDSRDPQYASTSENAIRALAAGATLVLYIGPADPGALIADLAAAVRNGRLSEQQIDDAARRLLVERLRLAPPAA